MNKYTIYCTEEQVRKAMELGAPIQELDNEVAIEDRSHIGFGLPAYGSFDDYLNKEEYPDVTIIEVDDVRYAYMIPTAEQMVNWLEEQGISIVSRRLFTEWGFMLEQLHEAGELNPHIGSNNIYLSHREATLAAIDAALEYMSEKLIL